jgi:hypothetical protein
VFLCPAFTPSLALPIRRIEGATDSRGQPIGLSLIWEMGTPLLKLSPSRLFTPKHTYFCTVFLIVNNPSRKMLYLSFRLDPTVVDNALDEWEDVEDQLDLPKEVRIELAHQAWKNGNGKLKIGKLAREFGISCSTLYDRIHGAIPKALASQAMQRLSVPEEKAIRNWLVELANWN